MRKTKNPTTIKSIDEQISNHYKAWLKKTKRSGSILTSHSLREWHLELSQFILTRERAAAEKAYRVSRALNDERTTDGEFIENLNTHLSQYDQNSNS